MKNMLKFQGKKKMTLSSLALGRGFFAFQNMEFLSGTWIHRSKCKNHQAVIDTCKHKTTKNTQACLNISMLPSSSMFTQVKTAEPLILHSISGHSRELCPVHSAVWHSTQCVRKHTGQLSPNCNLKSVAKLLFTLSEVLSQQPCSNIKYLFATSEIAKIFPV